jgi:hypothetical protein
LADLRRPGLRARTLIGAAIALAAHAVLILALAVGIRVAQAPNETQPISVSLIKLFTPHPKPTPPRPPPRAQAKVQPPTEPVRPPAAAPATTPPPLPGSAPVDPRIAAADAVRAALQATVRCARRDDFNMPPAEKEICARMIRDLRAGAPVYSVNADDHMRHDPPVASHGMAAHFGPLSPRPGNDLGPLIGPPPAIAGH